MKGGQHKNGSIDGNVDRDVDECFLDASFEAWEIADNSTSFGRPFQCLAVHRKKDNRNVVV